MGSVCLCANRKIIFENRCAAAKALRGAGPVSTPFGADSSAYPEIRCRPASTPAYGERNQCLASDHAYRLGTANNSSQSVPNGVIVAAYGKPNR